MEQLWKMINQKYVKCAAAAAGVYLFIRFLLPLAYPFVFAACIVVPLYPRLERIEKKTGIGRGFLTAGLLLFGGGIVLTLLWFGAAWIFGHVGGLMSELDLFQTRFCCFIEECCGFMEGKIGIDAASMENMILENVNIFIENLQVNIVPKMMKESVVYIKWFIRIGAFSAVSFIAVILLAKDYGNIREQISGNAKCQKAAEIAGAIGRMILTFLRAQIIILCCISITAGIWLFIAGIEGAAGIGILAGVMDVLPFIGTGIVLMPLAFWQLIQGEWVKALLCVIAYVCCAFIREFLEPKLIGNRMGIYPVFILLSVYAGVKLYGLGGIILGPLSLLLIRELLQTA